MDEVMTLHSNFLDECLKECLLTDQNLFRIISSMNLRTHFFSRVIVRFFMNVTDEERNGDQADGTSRLFLDELNEEHKDYEFLNPC